MTVRELNGYVPHSVTYGPDGEVLSVTVHEPRFTQQEKLLLLASMRRDREPRGEHGWRMSEATSPANMGRFQISEPLTDYAQQALIKGRDGLEKKYGKEMLEYLAFRVVKKP